MSGLLFGIGAVTAVIGAVLVGFGIPINEFSFGNTLILAGCTAIVGGLIVVALGVVVVQLQRVAEALATRAPLRTSRPLDMFEPPAAGARAAPPAGRVPFPPRPKSDFVSREPQPPEPRIGQPKSAEIPAELRAEAPADVSAGMLVEERHDSHFAPTLRNPDEPPVTVEDEVLLSPLHPTAAPAPGPDDLDEPRQESRQETRQETRKETRHEPAPEDGWRPSMPPAAPVETRPQQTAYFDAMWPAESKRARPAEPPQETASAEIVATESIELRPEAPAILKSGVVDGMGYTLYVDGSIEAELPQGTLRFASINELRSHLEKSA